MKENQSAPAWDRSAIPAGEYQDIARALASGESPVGIDAKLTHVLILHALERIEQRLATVERLLAQQQAARPQR